MLCWVLSASKRKKVKQFWRQAFGRKSRAPSVQCRALPLPWILVYLESHSHLSAQQLGRLAGGQVGVLFVPSPIRFSSGFIGPAFLCSPKSLLDISYCTAQNTQAFVTTLSAFLYSSSTFSSQLFPECGRQVFLGASLLGVELLTALTGNMLSSCEHCLWFSSGSCCLSGCMF